MSHRTSSYRSSFTSRVTSYSLSDAGLLRSDGASTSKDS